MNLEEISKQYNIPVEELEEYYNEKDRKKAQSKLKEISSKYNIKGEKRDVISKLWGTPEMKKTAANIDKAQADTQPATAGGSAKDETINKLGKEYDQAQANNDEAGAKKAMAKAQDEKDEDNVEYSQSDVEALGNALKNYKPQAEKQADSQERDDALDSLMEISKTADNESFENIAQMLEEEGNNLDITTPEGQKDAEEYIDMYSDLVNKSKAYKNLISTERKNRILTAISGGISAAFGVPAIDFTDSADTEEAKNQVKEIHSYLNDQREKQTKLEDKKRTEYIDNQKEQAKNKKIAAEQKADDAVKKYGLQVASDVMNQSALNADLDKKRMTMDIASFKDKNGKSLKGNSIIGKETNKSGDKSLGSMLNQGLGNFIGSGFGLVPSDEKAKKFFTNIDIFKR